VAEQHAREWYVYMLSCADGSLYTGATVDLERRLKQHNRGVASRYTRSRRPVAICYWEKQESHGAALRREIALKRYSKAQKLRLIDQAQTAIDFPANASATEH